MPMSTPISRTLDRGRFFNGAQHRAESATTTPVDLNGKGDNSAPTVLGVFQYSANPFTVMFSEEVNAQTATSSGSYANFLTSAMGRHAGGFKIAFGSGADICHVGINRFHHAWVGEPVTP